MRRTLPLVFPGKKPANPAAAPDRAPSLEGREESAMTMKTTLLGAGLALLAGVVTAGAADLTRRGYSRPYVAAAYSWMGPYLGGNVGYQWGDTSLSPIRPSGIAGGVQAGYNWQTGQFVFGGEADIQLSGADDTFAPWKFSNPWFGTLRGRVGIAFDNVLFYATGGLAYGGLRGELLGLSESKTHLGWTIGAGVEMGLAPNWTAKIEYLYLDLMDRGYAITGMDNGLQSNLVRLGVNYRF
jgi:outer membrane immunogenic protein